MSRTTEGTRFSGWVVAGSSAALIFIVAGTAFYGTSIFLVPLQEAFSTTRGTISRAFAIISLLTGLLVPVVGFVVDRWGPRRSLLFGTAGLAVIFVLLSRITTLTHLYLLVVPMGFVLPFAGGLPNQALIGRWFVRRRGRAMGLVGAGIGLGGLTLPWVLGTLVERHGFRVAYLFTALLFAAVCVPIVLILIRNSPQELGQVPDGGPGPGAVDEATKRRGLMFRHAVRLLPFWMILAAASCSQAAVGLISMHLPAMFQDAGLPLSQAGAFLGLVLGVGVAGRLLIGELSDKLKPRHLFLIACLGMGLSAFLLLRPDLPVNRFAFVVTYGTFQGAASTVIPLVVHSMFGGRAFGRIYGTILLFSAGTVALGNYMGGYIHDVTGNYTVAVYVAVALGASAATLAFFTRASRENEF